MDAIQLEFRALESLKRDRDESNISQSPTEASSSEILLQPPLPLSTTYNPMSQLSSAISNSTDRDFSPARCSTCPLTNMNISTPTTQNLSTSTFPALNSNMLPPNKRAKLTPTVNWENKSIKDTSETGWAEESAQVEVGTGGNDGNHTRLIAENFAKEAEKGLLNEAVVAVKKKGQKGREDGNDKLRKEEEKRRKEEEKRRKEEEKRRKEEEKRLRDEEKRRKEEEKRRKEEERQRIEEEKKKKKERNQPKLNAFFKTPTTSAKTQDSGIHRVLDSASVTYSENHIPSLASSSGSPSKSLILSDYERRFPPFFVQNNVAIASSRFERDQNTTTSLETILDGYICGGQTLDQRQCSSLAELLNISHSSLKARGRKCAAVSDIMANILGGARQPIDLTADLQNMRIKKRRDLLKSVPYKILSFAEDVRPPYKGTYTKWPEHGIKRLARNPFRRDLPKVNYDYDSEAEWVADEGEDLESDGGEDEECADDEDDLKGFIDDEDDLTINARKVVVQDDLEVQCTGLCFEDENRYNSNQMFEYRMAIIHENILDNVPIDPLATHYWSPPTSTSGLLEPRGPLAAMKSTSASVNGPNRAIKMLGASDCSKPVKPSAVSGLKKLVSAEDMPAFKQAIQGSDLTKLGLIEVLNKQFPKIQKAVLKTTLETVARRVGSKEADKRWAVIENVIAGGT